ncbi:MAG TPA: DUF2306 domain-containing protein, partial [Gemmatimonadaceae bacterium]|nr:DUF2306 domain-containing protein [Gemmatimonadaceae bacterium]
PLLKRVGWGVMTFLAMTVVAYALLLLVVPAARPPFLRERFAALPLATFAHLLAGAVALGVGPFQLSSGFRSRFLTAHRWMGRGYVAAVLAGGAGGLAMATVSMGGLPAHLGFGLLATLWLATVAVAYRRIRSGDVAGHRQWMIRNYALTLAAVTLRLYIPLSLAAGIPFEEGYPMIAWISWVPNLLVAEWLVRRRPGAKVPSPLPA